MSRRGGDRDSALALELHAVHGGTDLVLAADLVDRVNLPGVIEDALGQGRLARVDVRTDADVSDLADVAEHDSPRSTPPRLHPRVVSGGSSVANFRTVSGTLGGFGRAR